MPSDSGFSVVEVLVAGVLVLFLITGLMTGVDRGVSFSRAHPASVDLVQRARAALDVLSADVMMAGAGVDHGPVSGGLLCCLPPIVPRRIGLLGADTPTVARTDALSVTFVPPGVVGSVLQAPLVGTPAVPDLQLSAPCVSSLPACGITSGSTVVVFDRREHHTYYRLASTVTSALLSLRQAGVPHTFDAGASVVPVETHSYYFDASLRQLRHYDGYHSDVPVVDNVVEMRFEYAGDPKIPVNPKPPIGNANCLYDAAGGHWPTLAVLPGGGELVDLSPAIFRDGPWCGSGESRFDVDLLRIRRVRLVIRLQASDPLRTVTMTPMFMMPGTSLSTLRLVPDMVVSTDVSPRNVNAGR